MEKEQMERLLETGKRMGIEIGTLEERKRILLELENIGLPAGVWPMIKPVFFPKELISPNGKE